MIDWQRWGEGDGENEERTTDGAMQRGSREVGRVQWAQIPDPARGGTTLNSSHNCTAILQCSTDYHRPCLVINQALAVGASEPALW